MSPDQVTCRPEVSRWAPLRFRVAALLLIAWPGIASAQQPSCAEALWTVAEFNDGSRIEVEERRDNILRYDVIRTGGTAQESEVRDVFFVLWSRIGRKVSRFHWRDAPEHLGPLKTGATFTATAIIEPPEGRPQKLTTTVTIGEVTNIAVGACSYPTFEAIVINVFDDVLVQKVVRYVHEKSGLTLRTRVFAVAGGQEREIGSGEAVSLR